MVTGFGLVTPLGNTPQQLWDRLLAGDSGISAIDAYDTTDLPVKIAGTIKDWSPEPHLSPKEAKKSDLFIQYALYAAAEAVAMSQLGQADFDPARAGCSIGSGIGGIGTIEQQHQVLLDKGPRRISPFFITGAISNMAAGMASIKFGFQGPNYSVVTACSSGTHNIGMAAKMIRYGEVDMMLAGGSERGSSPIGMAAFAAARALSKSTADPTTVSRPWDASRDGFVLSDGAGILLLEEREHAIKRQAPILAELVGVGASADAHHITAPPEDGSGAALAIQAALRDANLSPEAIGYINAHGTSTPLGDIAEVNAVRTAFGAHADKLAISSTKSMLGHMLGAAGAVEAAITIMALQHQIAPPTINLQQPGPGCDLDFVPDQPRQLPLTAAMSNSFGFGGTNGSLIFTRAGAAG